MNSLPEYEYIPAVSNLIKGLTWNLCDAEVCLTSPRPTYHPEVFDNEYAIDYVVIVGERGSAGTFSMQVKASTNPYIGLPFRDDKGAVEAGLTLAWSTAVKYAELEIFPTAFLTVFVNQGRAVFYNGSDIQSLIRERLDGSSRVPKIVVDTRCLFPDSVDMFNFDPLNIQRVNGVAPSQYTTPDQRRSAIDAIRASSPEPSTSQRFGGHHDELPY